MTRVLVLGAGPGGLSTALLAARAGHDVLVLERDPAAPPADPRHAFDEWDRHGVAQFWMPHFMLPRWTRLMREHLPDVLAQLRTLGAYVGNPIEDALPRHSGGWTPGDERFESISARRPVLEAVLAHAAEAQPGVRVRRGVTARELRLAPRSPARIVGVITESGEPVDCDVLVDATGRRSAVSALLTRAGLGVPPEQRADSGMVYLSRHFRGRPGQRHPDPVAAFIQDYAELSVLTLPADNDTWSVTFAISGRDRELLALREEAAWHAALELFPLAAHWARGEPLGPVRVLAGIEDRVRDYAPDGVPVLAGLVAVGDAWASTNPALGRGTSQALWHAVLLRDVLAAASDPLHISRTWYRRTRTELEPMYDSTAAYDRNRLAEMEAHRAGARHDSADADWTATAALAANAGTHPSVLRGFLEVVGFLARPSEVATRPEIAPLLMARPPGGHLRGPDRRTLLAAVAAV